MNERQRIERLERRCRLLSVCLAGLLIVIVAGGFAADDAPTKIRATGLEIVDADGNVRMVMGRGDDNGYHLMIKNGKGDQRAILFAGDFAQGMRFGTERRKRSAMFYHLGDEMVLGIREQAGGCVMHVDKEGPKIKLVDADGNMFHSISGK